MISINWGIQICYLLTNVPLIKIYISESLQKLLFLAVNTSAICKFPLTRLISQAQQLMFPGGTKCFMGGH